MSLINISNLTFSYEGSFETVFSEVSLQLDTDWRLGLVGRNGRGKTTLLKLLAGELRGKGTISASTAFEYFPYKIDDTETPVIEIIRGIAYEAEDWEIFRETSLLDIDTEALYRPFCTLSGGEQTKAMLAGLFLKRNAFLLIDEPTNHLDSNGRRLLGSYIARKKGFILVSHDRSFLDLCTDHILSINKCNIELQKGNYSEWQRSKDMRDAFELSRNEKLKKDIKRLEAAAARTSEWSDKVEKSRYGTKNSGVKADRGYVGHKSAKMMKRSKSIEARQQAAADEKSTLLHNIEQTFELKMQPLAFHSEKLVQLENVSVSYGGKPVCGNISFTVTRGEQAAIVGRNGCGKSSILKLICGEKMDYTGSLIMNGQLKISYVPQKTDHLRGTLREYAEKLGIDLSLFLAILRKFDFSSGLFEQHMEHFSAGQKKKVMLAGSLCERAHLYVWDEPLNYVDIVSRIQIEELILKSRPTMIFVEHDETFREKIAGKVILIE